MTIQLSDIFMVRKIVEKESEIRSVINQSRHY